MAEADRDLLERVFEAIGTGPDGWTTAGDVLRRIYGDRPPTVAQRSAIAAALTTLHVRGAIVRAGDAYRQTGTQP